MVENVKNEFIKWIEKVKGKYQQKWTFVKKIGKFYNTKWILYLRIQKY